MVGANLPVAGGAVKGSTERAHEQCCQPAILGVPGSLQAMGSGGTGSVPVGPHVRPCSSQASHPATLTATGPSSPKGRQSRCGSSFGGFVLPASGRCRSAPVGQGVYVRARDSLTRLRACTAASTTPTSTGIRQAVHTRRPTARSVAAPASRWSLASNCTIDV